MAENIQHLKWETDTKFEFIGTEFSQLHNSLKMIVESPQYQEDLKKAQQIVALGQLYELTTKKVHEAHKDGRAVIIDAPETSPSVNEEQMATSDELVHTMD